jgi:hypothetical protein
MPKNYRRKMGGDLFTNEPTFTSDPINFTGQKLKDLKDSVTGLFSDNQPTTTQTYYGGKKRTAKKSYGSKSVHKKTCAKGRSTKRRHNKRRHSSRRH